MSAGATPPPEPFQRMARTVLQIVRADPRVQKLDPPLRLSVHTRAIWVEVGPMDAQMAFRIEESDWWAPLKNTRARELAARLVEGVLTCMSGRPQRQGRDPRDL
jgi:hypothetical protein